MAATLTYTSNLEEATVNRLLANVAGGTLAGSAAPTDWNGAVGDVDLAKPVDHTSEWGKLIRMPAGRDHFDLNATILYYLWLAQGKPEVAVGDNVAIMTKAQIDVAVPYIRVLIARYRVYRMFSHGDVVFEYRAADMLDNDFLADNVKHTELANHIYSYVTTAGVQENLLAQAGRFVMLQIISNAIHREQNDGHTWFTKEANVASSPTAKALGVAGRDKKGFKAHMAVHGHDSGHHLATSTQGRLAKIMCKSEAMLVAVSFIYLGLERRNSSYSTFVDLGAAADYRYPAGCLGKAAMITGLGYASTMVMSFSERAKLTGHGGVTANIATLLARIRDGDFVHRDVLKISNALGPMLAFVYGYCIRMDIIDDEDAIALKSHASRHLSEKAAGQSLAQTFKKCKVHIEAAQGAIIAAISTLSTSVLNVAAMSIANDDTGLPLPICAGVDEVNVGAITVAVGKPAPVQQNQGGGTMFWETDS